LRKTLKTWLGDRWLMFAMSAVLLVPDENENCHLGKKY